MEVLDFLRRIPPVTRILFCVTLVQSTLIHAKLISGSYAYFALPFITKFPPEIWRLFTSFCVTQGGMAYIMDLYCLYTYGIGLEHDAPRFTAPGDFLVYVLFVATFILMTAGVWLGMYIFLPVLNVAFAYTYGQVNRGQQVTFIVVPMRVEIVPWAMLGLTVIMSGWEMAFVLFMGLVAAHLFEFLTQLYPQYGGGRNYIVTPNFVRRWFRAPVSQGIGRSYGRVFNSNTGPSEAPRGTTSSVAPGLQGGGWNSRGPGRRLGS